MINKLNSHYSFTNPATVHDEEALTTLELVGRTTAKVNQCVDEVNNIPDKIAEDVTKHIEKGTFNEQIDVHTAEVLKQIANTEEEFTKQLADTEEEFERLYEELEASLGGRLNNLLGAVTTGSTSMDAEIIDARLGYNGTEFTNLGLAIREQIKIYARRYRNVVNNVIGLNGGIQIDTVNKTITIDTTTENAVLYTNNTFATLQGVKLECSYAHITDPYTYNVIYDHTSGALSISKLNPADILEAKFILFSLYMYPDNIVAVIGCDDVKERLFIDGKLYGNEITDARLSYDDTEYYTLGYHLRGLGTKFARRYRNWVLDLTDKTSGIQIDTVNKTISIDASNNSMVLYGHNNFATIQNKVVALDYSTINSAWTYMLCYSNGELSLIKHNADIITEGLHVICLLFTDANGVIYDILASNTNVLERIFVDGVPRHSTPSQLNSSTCKIFQKVCCVGDSFTAGYIYNKNDGSVTDTNEKFAWPSFMERITGNKFVNCGHSGANVLTWQTVERGLPKAEATGKVQAYLIGLGLNDISSSDRGVELGTSADIGTEAQTYYGGLSKIVRELKAISPEAMIFIQTMPSTNETVVAYNEAIRTVVDTYKNTYDTHLLDLYAYRDLYGVSSITGDATGGHYTAIAYQQFAEILCKVWSDYINKNIDKFQQVHLIDYEE